mgnify:CR=1 FL=1
MTYGVRRNVWVLIASWALFGIARALTQPFVADYIKQLGAPDWSIGLAYSLAYLFSLILLIPGGSIADYYGRYRIVVSLTWVMAFSYLLRGLAPSWEFFITVQILTMSIASTYMPALRSLYADSLPVDKRAAGFIISSIVPSLASLPMPIIAGLLYHEYGLQGYRMTYLIAFIIAMIVSSLRQVFLRETLRERVIHLPLKMVLLNSYREALKVARKFSSESKLVILFRTLLSFASGLTMPYLMIYAIYDIGLSHVEWGIAQTLSSGFMIIGGLALSFFIDKIPRRYSLLAMSSLAGLLIFLFTISNSVLSIISVALFLGLVTQINGIISAYATDVANIQLRGRFFAILLFASFLSTSFASALTTLLFSLSHSLPFFTSVITYLMISLIVLLVK